jgi:hypothetical protein
VARTAWQHVAAAAVLACAAAGCSSSAAPPTGITTAFTRPAPAATEVIVYEPFTKSGAVAAGIHVVGRSRNADCYEGAISSPRRDAFRCFSAPGAEPFVADPCFLDPHGPPRLACLQGDNPSRVVIVTPARPFPQNPNRGSVNVSGGFPWLIKLSNGQVCADNTGASAYYRSIGRANWICPGGAAWGIIHRNGRHWTVAYSSGPSLGGRTAPRVTEIAVTTAWF